MRLVFVRISPSYRLRLKRGATTVKLRAYHIRYEALPRSKEDAKLVVDHFNEPDALHVHGHVL